MLGFLPKPTQRAVACLALGLALLASLAGVWHSEQQSRDCPVCQIANLPLVAPSAAPALAPPRLIEHCPTPSDALQSTLIAVATHAPRAPPASA